MAAALGRGNDLPPSGELGDLDLKRCFLGNLAVQGRVKGLTEFDAASRQRIEALGWRSRAPHQQDLAVAKYDRADGELGMVRLRRRRQGSISDKMPSAAYLKFVFHKRRIRSHELQIESGTRIIALLVPITFRSS